MMIDSINKQLQIVNMLKQWFNQKHEEFKEHKMFYENHWRYVVQLRYSNTPIELMDDADSMEVGTVEEV